MSSTDVAPAPPSPLWTTIAFVSIAASSVYYTWVWRDPQSYKRFAFPKDPCQHMGAWANVLKLVQVISVCMCTDWRWAVTHVPLWQWALSFALITFGQHLNFLVYKLLGVNGVYYGNRFGKSLPWIDGYPYSLISDPQYVGCLITILGCALVAPIEHCLFFAANYLYLIWHESEIPASSNTSTVTVAELSNGSSKQKAH